MIGLPPPPTNKGQGKWVDNNMGKWSDDSVFLSCPMVVQCVRHSGDIW